MAKYKILLASNSPRRRELLSGLGLDFEVPQLQDIDETYPQDLRGEDIPTFISRAKAGAYEVKEDELLITADTIVYCDEEVLGKPATEKDACRMLHKLSGRTHQVITGVTLKTKTQTWNFACTTQVTFAHLEKGEITHYVKHYAPYDKAGSYGVQEWIGYIGVTHIEGSYYNVMGLPVQKLYTELKKHDLI